MKLDGSDVRRLTDFGSMSWAPYYHPSGKYVIFTSNKLGFGNFELYLVGTEGGGEPIRVTYSDGFDGLPVFSPDGKKLCWTSARTADGKSQLFLADWVYEALAQFSPEITVDDLKREVGFLASDELEGRMTGSKGAQRARVQQLVLDRINTIRPQLPSDATVTLGPNASSIGWIYQYAIVDHETAHDMRELRLMNESQIKPALQAVPDWADLPQQPRAEVEHPGDVRPVRDGPA